MFKKLILLLLFLILSGCTAEYNLTFNEYFELEEEIIFLENNEFFTDSFDNVEDGITTFIHNQYNAPEYNLYDKEKLIGDVYSGVSLKREYKSIYKLLNAEYFSSFFEEVIFEESEGVVNIKFILKDLHYFNEERGTLSSLSKININIETPYLVIDGNYDSYDKDNNVMKWVFNENNYSDIAFNLDTKYTKENVLIENSIFDEPKTFDSFYILIGIFVIMLLGMAYIYMAYQKNNRI